MRASTDTSPFAPAVRPVTDDDDPAPADGRPATLLPAPAGGPVLLVTQESLARELLSDPRIVKDPAWAPADWDPAVAGLEQTATQQPSLTTLDGSEHAALRRAHAPLFTARRLRAEEPAIVDTARTLLRELGRNDPVDLMADFTTRFPLTVLLDLLGIGHTRVDEAARACRAVLGGDVGGIAVLGDIADDGVRAGATRATELGERLPAGATRADLRYHLFGMILAGQLTTDAALGEVVLAELTDRSVADPEERVERVLQHHPPQPMTLWRFTSVAMEVAGIRLAPRTPVLVDLRAVCRAGAGMAFGAGPHVCIGAQLARIELRAALRVLRADFPDARLAVDVAEVHRAFVGGAGAARLTTLPVLLGG